MACDPAKAKEALTKAFQMVDTNKSGSIEADEVDKVLMAYYKSSGKPCDSAKCKTEREAFMRDVDKNKDNKISLDEFVKYFMQFCK